MTEREGDRELWKPEVGNPKASTQENERVRRMLQEHLEKQVRPSRDVHVSDEDLERLWGFARGGFAVSWVDLCAKLGLKGPGEDRRAPLRPGENARQRQVDAARTRLRQFLEGHQEQEWVLVGIESTICELRGMALPGKAYQVQQKLSV